jgi:hypothetical protein
MKINAKSVVVLASGAIMLPGLLCQTAQAQGLLNESGESILADALGTATGPEALIVSWSVVENASDIYTYTYTVNNPSGDVRLNNKGRPTSTREIVDSFSVDVNTRVPGAYLPGSQIGGSYQQNNGVDLKWYFGDVEPGHNSGPLSFESYLPPTPGDANAADANPPSPSFSIPDGQNSSLPWCSIGDGKKPPSPWSSIPDGQQVPVPGPLIGVPEPTTIALLALTALLLLPIRTTMRKKAGSSQ